MTFPHHPSGANLRLPPFTGLFVIGLISLGVCAAPAPRAKAAPPSPPPLLWKAGVASVAITPTNNLWMAGYAARKKPAEGKAQELFAKALALQDEQGQKLVIVTMDLIGVGQPLRQRLAERAQKELGLPPQFLLLNASHTHSGPSLRTSPATPKDLENPRTRDSFGTICRRAPVLC